MLTGLVLLGTLAVPAATAQTVNMTEATQVISGADLRSLGVVRLSDIVDYFGDARVLSADGFTTRIVLGGIGSFDETPPSIFVDGHPVDQGLFAMGDVDLIGLPLEVIDRIEIYARPTLISGLFAGQGAIHIYTKQADAELDLHAAAMAGVRNAEAGLLSLSGGPTVNTPIDDLDAYGSGLGELGPGSVLGSVVHRRHVHAERRERSPLSTVTSPASVFTMTNSRMHLSVVGLGAASDRFAYLPNVARVLSTEHRGGTASAMAFHQIGERRFLQHRATVSLSRTRYHGGAGSWNDRSVVLTTALGRTLEKRIVVLGGTGELRRTLSGDESRRLLWGSMFAAIAGRMAPGTTYRSGGSLSMDGRSVAVKAYGGITFARREDHRADVYIAVVDALPHEQNAFDFWAREGLMPPLVPNDVERLGQDVPVRATADLEWRWRHDPLQQLRLGAGLRRSERLYLPTRTYTPAGSGGLLQTVEFDRTSGTLAVLWGEFDMNALPGRQRLYWNWQRTLTSEEAFNRVWSAVSDLRAGVSFATPMYAGMRLRGAVTHESARSWPEFDHIRKVDGDLEHSNRIDLYATTRLFRGQLHASIGVLNVLNDAVTYHPLGATFGRSVRLDIRLNLVRP